MASDDVRQGGIALLERAKQLQSELEEFTTYTSNIYHGKPLPVPFMGAIKTECVNLAKVTSEAASDNDLKMAAHRVQSTNLPFYEALWNVAKNSKDLVLFRLHACYKPTKDGKPILAPGMRITRYQGDSRQLNECTIVVDVVADKGESWYKVSTMNNKRIMFDMAREAIFCGDDDSSDDDQDTELTEDADLPIVKLAKNLVEASRWYQIRTTAPRVTLVLPRVVEGENDKIDKVVALCRKMGVNMQCGPLATPSRPLTQQLMNKMAPHPMAGLSQVLNIDTSVLVTLASDLSHGKLEKASWWRAMHEDHALQESKNPILAELYPILQGHDLVCTREAADTFHSIINTIATPSERIRASLILGTEDDDRTPKQRLEQLQTHSIRDVPVDLRLPIRVVDHHNPNAEDNDDGSPRTAAAAQLSEQVLKKMEESMPNPSRAVFLYGWATGQTTVTCSSVMMRQLEKDLETLTSPPLDDDWPSIWALSESRPLFGKPKPEHDDEPEPEATTGEGERKADL